MGGPPKFNPMVASGRFHSGLRQGDCKLRKGHQMAIEIRPASAGEMDQIGLMGSYSYGGSFGDGPENITASSNRPEWTLCAFDGATMATSFSAFPFTMRANGKAMAYAGISSVGTRPEYRRQGLLRRIMTQAFADMRERGQSVAGLWASQAGIYQRYGFSINSFKRKYQVDTADIRFNKNDRTSLKVLRFSPEEIMSKVKDIYQEFVKDRMSYLHRSSALWMNNVFEEGEDGPVYVAAAFDGEDAKAYMAYTLRANKVENRARPQEIKILDFCWLNLSAYQSIWEYLSLHDLVGRVTWETAPQDDPAQEIFQEPRMLHTGDGEGAWFRVVDVPAALSKRGYFAEGRAVIEVFNDDIAPWNNDVWDLEVGGGDVRAERSKSTADVRVDIKVLGSIFTGIRRARELASWGLVDGSEHSISELDQLFVTRHAPHCPDHY